MEMLVKKRLHLSILIAVICLGVFLRTYKFHDWLSFELDQVRDATLVGQIVEGKAPIPLLGPTMRKSGESKDNLFHLGPIYYHFQIACAKIFGNDPDKLAYPDLFFSILTIPLLYFFLKKYFSANISLSLVALYSISFFAIRYSRFAWNPNSIPFFSLLFLFSLHEFLKNKEQARWIWAILLGISLGVGIQLHVILLLIFPLAATIVFLFLLKKNHQLWKKGIIVLVIAVLFNFGQIISEQKTGFSNTKLLFNSPVKNSGNDKFMESIFENVDCSLEANPQILSSLAPDECKYSYQKLLTSPFKKNVRFAKKLHDPLFSLGLISGMLFSIFGYLALVFNFKKETDQDKKSFLGLIILYSSISFLIMIPVISSNFTEFRYFIHVSFLPYLFLGFLVIFLRDRLKKSWLIICATIFIFFAIANLYTIKKIVMDLSDRERTDSHFVVLGEVEIMSKFLLENSDSQKIVYLNGDPEFMSNLLKPLAYLGMVGGIDVQQAGVGYPIPPNGTPLFYITHRNKINETNNVPGEFEMFKEFGKIGIYKLKN